jgi:methyl-accepting chemotaxis protein
MKIQTSLVIVNILFVIAISSLFAVLFIYNRTTSDYEDIIEQSYQVNTMMYQSHLNLQKVLTGSELSREYRTFTKNYTDLEQNIEAILSSPLYIRSLANDKYAQKYENSLRELLELNRTKIEELTPRIETLVSEDPDASGLLRQLASETGSSEKYLKETVSQINFLSASFRNSFVFTMDQIVKNICSGSQREVQNILHTSVYTAGGIVLVVLVLSVLVIVRLRRQIQWLRHSMAVISEGDFTHRIPEQGKNELSELAFSVNQFVEDFSTILDDIKELTQQNTTLHSNVSRSSSESTAAVKEMSKNISEITGLTDNLVNHLEDSFQEIEKVTTDINTLTDEIKGQSSSVNQSSSAVQQMTAGIENISTISEKRKQATEKLSRITNETGEKINQTNGLIEENTGNINEILEVVNIINNVASQTNLLSMNAAIEAAHAGQAGRGFAVVAEEIRNLAESTNENSKKIKSTINTITERMERIYEMSEDTQEAFRHINDETNQSNESMAEISSNMQELAQGSREIMDAMSALSQTTQDIQAGSERMQESSVRVKEHLREINNIGQQVNGKIHEIEEETQEINGSMSRIDDLNEENRISIQHLFEEIKRFRTDEGEAFATEQDAAELHKSDSDNGG